MKSLLGLLVVLRHKAHFVACASSLESPSFMKALEKVALKLLDLVLLLAFLPHLLTLV